LQNAASNPTRAPRYPLRQLRSTEPDFYFSFFSLSFLSPPPTFFFISLPGGSSSVDGIFSIKPSQFPWHRDPLLTKPLLFLISREPESQFHHFTRHDGPLKPKYGFSKESFISRAKGLDCWRLPLPILLALTIIRKWLFYA
jgi:hypothetical protein